MKLRGNKAPVHSEHLFEDESLNQQYNMYYPPESQGEYGQQSYQPQPQNNYGNINTFPMFSDPINSMAVNYIAGAAPEIFNKDIKNLQEYVEKSNIKSYFSITTNYVLKKLGLLFFPFFHKNWSDESCERSTNINARDLYIPVMCFVTYILIAGVALGTQDKFSPEKLGYVASSAFVCSLIEYFLVIITIYVLNIFPSTNAPNYLDWIAYIGYKYFGMILILAANILFFSMGYYIALSWMSLSLCYFLVRSLEAQAVINIERHDLYRKRFVYLLLFLSLMQISIMWWLTKSI